MTQLPGERLKEARQHQQLSEQEVAGKLHLSLTYLRALEADNYEQLPEATFIKGYFRNYARLLGVPAEEVTAAFEALQAEQVPPVNQDAQTAVPYLSRRQWVWMLSALVLVVVLIGWWLSSGDAPSAPVDVTDTPAVQAPVTPAPTPTDAGNTQTNAATPTPAPSSVTPAADTSPAAPKPLETAELKLTFSANCWLEVTDASGKSLFKGARSAGELSLSGQPPFDVMLGNAAGVASVSVDGKTVALPSAAAGDVIHLQAP